MYFLFWSIIIKLGTILFLIRECIPKFKPQIEFNLNRPPVLCSGNAKIHIGFLIVIAKWSINFASVNVVWKNKIFWNLFFLK